MAAIQLVLLEPQDWVKDNDKFKVAGEAMIDLLVDRCKWIKTKYK